MWFFRDFSLDYWKSKKKLIVAEHKEEKDIEEEAEMDEGRRRGSGVNEVTWASQPVRNRLSVHVKYGAKGDDEE